MKPRIPDVDFIKIVTESVSISEVIRRIGWKVCGGSYNTVKARIQYLKLDVKHFTGQRSNAGARYKGGNKKLSWQEVLVNQRKPQKEHVAKLRSAMIDTGIVYRCARCQLPPNWCGDNLTLEIDHINGDNVDNRPENIRFLCPNCHAQTPTYGSKNRKLIYKHTPVVKDRESGRCIKDMPQICIICNSEFFKRKIQDHCGKSCARKHEHNRKVMERPSKETLEIMISTMPVVAIGKHFGVSDNAIRKWAKAYGIVQHKRQYTRNIKQITISTNILPQ